MNTTNRKMTYGHQVAIMILTGEKMGLNPAHVHDATSALDGKEPSIITAKWMEKAAFEVRDALAKDQSLIDQGNKLATELKIQYGFLEAQQVSTGWQKRPMTLKQAGRHLLRVINTTTGTQDHERVCELAMSEVSIGEVERKARLNQEHAADVDDALNSIRGLMDGKKFPLSQAQVKELCAEDVAQGTPSAEFKALVLNTVYDMDRIKVITGYQYLAAAHPVNNVGIVVVNGNFSRDHYKRAIAEATAEGLKATRLYVYGETATYSGPAIQFVKFDEIGLSTERDMEALAV